MAEPTVQLDQDAELVVCHIVPSQPAGDGHCLPAPRGKPMSALDIPHKADLHHAFRAGGHVTENVHEQATLRCRDLLASSASNDSSVTRPR